MKKHLSVLMLLEKKTIYKILLTFLAMVGIECGLAVHLLYSYLSKEETPKITFQTLFSHSYIIPVFLGSFLILTLILCLNGCEFKGKPSYTLRRLSISEQSIFLWQSLYNSGCYFMLLAVQLAGILLLFFLFKAAAPNNTFYSQSLFITFYTNSFLHSLLPLEEISRWIRNICLCLGLGFAAAYQPFAQRRRKRQGVILVLCYLAILCFRAPLGSFANDMFVIGTSIFTVGYLTYLVFRKEASYEN